MTASTGYKLSKLSDAELLERTERLVQHEAQVTAQILHHLNEIDTRKLYAEKNCDSLFSYCIRILRYSESQSHRRITAARLLRQIPSIEAKIASGSLSLSNLSQAQSFFRNEGKQGRALSIERKTEVLTKLEDKSAREAERILIQESPKDQPLRRENLRMITANAFEMRITIDHALLRKIARVKTITGHKMPHASWAEIINFMCDETLSRHDPLVRANRLGKAKPAENYHSSDSVPKEQSFGMSSPSTSKVPRAAEPAPPWTIKRLSREAIPAAIKHAVWNRDLGHCSHVDERTGQRCGSQLRVEIDHIRPVASGGDNSLENLRLLCWAHNQRRNIPWRGPPH